MTAQLSAPPVLSTPDTYVFEDSPPVLKASRPQCLTDEEVRDVYEISRTAKEIAEGGWQRIALQFPDGMLRDAPRVVELLQSALVRLRDWSDLSESNGRSSETVDGMINGLSGDLQEINIGKQDYPRRDSRRRLYILADTSYGACCVDEIAAEHIDADVVVHYGRSCLSPTARLPVIYVFTTRQLPLDPVIAAFQDTFPVKETKVVLMADITYSNHVTNIVERLKSFGYLNIFAPSIIHDPSSPLPNRTVPPLVTADEKYLKDYHLFHISEPPTSLLLTLSSRLQSMHIYPTTDLDPTKHVALQAQTSQMLRRRYALITSLTTCSIFGILINTLSVKNYLSTVDKIRAQLAAAGKKSYTFVVGKVNAAKVANFSEIGGWVVVGCWESSLIESADFYRPIITPFELSLTLMRDDERVWTGEWSGDFNSVAHAVSTGGSRGQVEHTSANDEEEVDDEEESEPPEFDLRTGRYVSHSRPMAVSTRLPPHTHTDLSMDPGVDGSGAPSTALMKRLNGDIVTINGTASPGAEFLRSQRIWKGLGSDFDVVGDGNEDRNGGAIEVGKKGVARGYTAGEDGERR